MHNLFIYPKKEPPFVVVLGKDRISLGRTTDNTVAIPDAYCSSHHAFIFPTREGYTLQDNNSKNGTFLNGRSLTSETPLKKGDEILIGLTRITFDQELLTNVEVLEIPSPPESFRTVIPVGKILEQPEVQTPGKPTPAEFGRERFRPHAAEVSQSIVQTAIEKNSSILCSNVRADDRFRSRGSIIRSQVRSVMCVPLWTNTEIIGVIYSDRISLLDQFSEDDLRLLTLLSNLAAIKIENARLFEQSLEKERMEKELALAAQIQRDFLPKVIPEYECFEIAGSNTPCFEVGGDYYDFIPIDSERLAVVIADVSGKGMGAALFMASLRAALQTEIHPRYSLEAMAAKLNDFVHRSSASNLFISFFFGELNTAEGYLTYINAGHNPPMRIDSQGKIVRLPSSGFCLGMFPSVNYPDEKTILNLGDTLLLFTDGITESMNRDNQEFGEERLTTVLERYAKLRAPEIMEKIVEEVRSYSAGAVPNDDMTLVVIKRTK